MQRLLPTDTLLEWVLLTVEAWGPPFYTPSGGLDKTLPKIYPIKPAGLATEINWLFLNPDSMTLTYLTFSKQ